MSKSNNSLSITPNCSIIFHTKPESNMISSIKSKYCTDALDYLNLTLVCSIEPTDYTDEPTNNVLTMTSSIEPIMLTRDRSYHYILFHNFYFHVLSLCYLCWSYPSPTAVLKLLRMNYIHLPYSQVISLSLLVIQPSQL